MRHSVIVIALTATFSSALRRGKPWLQPKSIDGVKVLLVTRRGGGREVALKAKTIH